MEAGHGKLKKASQITFAMPLLTVIYADFACLQVPIQQAENDTEEDNVQCVTGKISTGVHRIKEFMG